ncbi:MAG: ATP-binding protein [Polyangiaceae bacterium]
MAFSDDDRWRLRCEQIFEAAGDGLMVMDEEARPLAVNARLCRMLGRTREQVLAMAPADGIADLERQPMRFHLLEGQEQYSITRQLRHAEGHAIDIEATVTRIATGEILAVIRDVSDRVRTQQEQEELQRKLELAQRMESLGRLAGGVAHDFNNLLTVIMANVDLLLSRDPGSKQLHDITLASERAASLTRQLLAFSNSPSIRPQVLEVATLIREAAAMLERVLGEDYPLVLELEARPSHVMVDAGQFGQVIVNLALNARDAMPQGGSIRIETLRDEAAQQLLLAVSDGGPGVPAELRQRIFEPFFSSKPLGQGTGLGLATVFGIVRHWGGTVEVKDAALGGARFEVRCPVVESVPAHQASDDAPTTAVPLRILLVEDDAAVRGVVTRILESFGHTVYVYPGPLEVLAARATLEGTYDLLLTDVVMPEMDGPSMAAELGASNVVYMSGYPGDALARRGLELAPDRFLSKPFSPAALAEVVARAGRG